MPAEYPASREVIFISSVRKVNSKGPEIFSPSMLFKFSFTVILYSFCAIISSLVSKLKMLVPYHLKTPSNSGSIFTASLKEVTSPSLARGITAFEKRICMEGNFTLEESWPWGVTWLTKKSPVLFSFKEEAWMALQEGIVERKSAINEKDKKDLFINKLLKKIKKSKCKNKIIQSLKL